MDVDWGGPWQETGAALLSRAVESTPHGRRLMYALDRPHPWHSEPERPRELFDAAGFSVAREGKRWEWNDGPTPHRPQRLGFRTIEDVGDEVFLDAIARVSDGTLDRRLQGLRAQLGRADDAINHLRLLRRLEHE